MKNVLILGVGSLGCSIAHLCKQAGDYCIMASQSGKISNPYWQNLLSDIDVIELDLLNDISALNHLKDIDVVYYTAAPKYWLWQQELRAMTKAGLDVAKNLGAVFVYADNLYAYGPPPKSEALSETSSMDAQSNKGLARKDALQLVLDTHDSKELPIVVVQASDFYGPGVTISMLGNDIFSNALNDKPVYLLGKTDKLHSFTYIDDFARAMITLGSDQESYGQVWIAPTAPALSVDGFLQQLETETKKTIIKKVAPKFVFYLLGLRNKPIKEIREVYYLYSNDFVVDSEKITNQFNINATPISDGIKETIKSYSDVR